MTGGIMLLTFGILFAASVLLTEDPETFENIISILKGEK